ncbi:hypothetical protein [Pseudomonas fluorescens]|uniref:Uncharacterized protein n=2 Tax=Pseudomonas fluorescens TaxID=294 RepID=A0ABY1TEL3_PSEFL|nr:hypothetical protein [Pseudomonas fluorescens]MCI4605344.1 hypothetical protein [Pseudomonas fluorescens]PQB00179.1 hypothetical protein B0A76_14110 [Pseudomonas fluorescens]RFP96760.1 hypothetical protein D0N73_07630 [Pseudomonas fluorescens]RMO68120.1 hypothetical protein ALQ35_03902 [Pseudomonas fluorescens]TWR48654.1 hypothetical protein FIP59_07275 [Pseudomonas fluorescens]
MTTARLHALKNGRSHEFSFNSDPKCPHCGEDFIIQKNEAWSLYSDDDHHDVECPNCSLEFTVVTYCQYKFSTDEQEDEA